MRVALVQMDIVWSSPAENIKTVERLTHGCDADLYVLPEMWATGYSPHPEDVAERESESMALAWMKEFARKRQCAVCGSLAVADADGEETASAQTQYRNRFYFVTPEGIAHYDKHHLFTFAHEDESYKRGDNHVTVCFGGMRFLLMVCYDLRFPLWSRWGRAGEYDAIIYVANWPVKRQTAWDTLLKARAIENQCYVVAVNRVGKEHKSIFAGGSVVIDPLGTTISACEDGESVCLADIDSTVVTEQREKFPVLRDAD